MTDGELDFEVVGFFAADHAVAVEGKVYVNGGFWDVIRFPSYPQALPVAVVAVLRVPSRAYHQDHRFEITMEDSDLKEVQLRAEGEFRVGSSAEMRRGDPTILPLVVNGQVTVPRAGDYSFHLRVDGSPMARYPIRALQIAPTIQVGEGPPNPPRSGSEPGDVGPS